jgi:hypothetical protein
MEATTSGEPIDLEPKKNIPIDIMLNLTKNNTNPVGVNKTFVDSSSRTEFLKRALLKRIQKVVPKTGADQNHVQLRLHKVRHSGGSIRRTFPS